MFGLRTRMLEVEVRLLKDRNGDGMRGKACVEEEI